MYSTVVPELEKIPEVIECHFTTGPYTMLIKLFVRDNEHLMELLNKKIQMIPGVTGTETLISLDHASDTDARPRRGEVTDVTTHRNYFTKQIIPTDEDRI